MKLSARTRVLRWMAMALALGGCARLPFPVIDAKMNALKGQPIKALVDKLGSPAEQSQAGGEKVYTWALSNNLDAVYQAVGFTCTIKVFVGKDDKITHYTYDGNVGGCGRYAHKLDDTFQTSLTAF